MSVLTSWTFWVILGVIVLVMALIGYLAEGTDFANKALEKKPKEKKVKEEPVKEIKPKSFDELKNEIPAEAGLGTLASGEVVDVDKPIEVLNVGDETPSAWTEETPVEDERQETVVNVPTIDDWSVIPESGELPEVKLDNLEPTTETSEPVEEPMTVEEPVQEVTSETVDSDIFPDIKPSDLEPTPEITVESDPFEEAPVVMEPGTEDKAEENKNDEDVWKV